MARKKEKVAHCPEHGAPDVGNHKSYECGCKMLAGGRKPAKSKEQKKKEKKGRDPFKRAVVALATARHELAEVTSSLELKQQMFDKQNASLLKNVEAAKLAVELNDNTLREYLVERHGKTGETAFGPGIDIKTRIVAEVQDLTTLREWAMVMMPFILTPNVQMAQALVKLGWDIPGMALSDVPTAYITKDLDKVIEAMWS